MRLPQSTLLPFLRASPKYGHTQSFLCSSKKVPAWLPCVLIARKLWQSFCTLRPTTGLFRQGVYVSNCKARCSLGPCLNPLPLACESLTQMLRSFPWSLLLKKYLSSRRPQLMPIYILILYTIIYSIHWPDKVALIDVCYPEPFPVES